MFNPSWRKSIIRILHNINGIGPTSFGLGPVALNLAKGQVFLGHDATVWCCDNKQDVNWASESVGLPSNAIHGFSTLGPRSFGFSPEMERAAANVGNNFDVVHQHCIWTGNSRTTNVLRKKHSIPTVIAPHGSLERWALLKSRGKKRLALSLYEKENLRGASCLHACSEQEVTSFRAFNLRQPVAVIPNGIDESWLDAKSDGESFRRRYCIPPSKRIMLFLSRISPIKGLPLLIEAMASCRSELKDWVLVVAGSDEFGGQRQANSALRKWGLNGQVFFTGLLLGDLKRDAFAAAEVFVLPSLRENFGIVVAEALGAGLPVLTTKETPWEEIHTHRCGWWVAPEPDAFSESIKEISNKTSQELARMGLRGRSLVESKYTWSRVSQMTIELYRWLLGDGEIPGFVVLD